MRIDIFFPLFNHIFPLESNIYFHQSTRSKKGIERFIFNEQLEFNAEKHSISIATTES